MAASLPAGRRRFALETTLIFTDDDRHFLSSDRVTTVNASDALLLRIDMPGHIRHTAGDTFEHVYLGYEGAFLTPADFEYDFPPDEKYLYRRSADRSPPEHFVRAYQVRRGDASRPWLAGITLEPADVHEAWCHQRGYICMIREIGGRPVSPGDTFGTAYAVGWFDDLDDMRRASDAHRGVSGWRAPEPAGELPSVRWPATGRIDGRRARLAASRRPLTAYCSLRRAASPPSGARRRSAARDLDFMRSDIALVGDQAVIALHAERGVLQDVMKHPPFTRPGVMRVRVGN